MSSDELAAQVGMKGQNLRRIERNEGQPTLDQLLALATALKANLSALVESDKYDVAALMSSDRARVRVPVFGWGGGKGKDWDVNFSSGAVDYLTDWIDPPMPGSYAVQVSTHRMIPRFMPRQLVVVQPNRSVRPGDFAVIQVDDGDHKIAGLIREIVTLGDSDITVKTLNPVDNHTISRKKIAAIHYIKCAIEP